MKKGREITKRIYIKKFIIEHPGLFAIFAIAVFLIIKNSEIPYVFGENCIVIRFLFDKVQNEFWKEVAVVIDLFATAYATSLFFYYIVDYVPAQKICENAKETLKPWLIKMYLEMNHFYEMIKFSAIEQQIWDEDSFLDSMLFSNKMILCKIVKENSTYYLSNFEFVTDIQNHIKRIKELSDWICRMPSFQYLNEDEKDMIAMLQNLELYKLLPSSEKRAIKGVNYGEKVRHFKSIRDVVGKLVCYEGKIRYEKLPEDVRAEYEKEIAETRRLAIEQGYDISMITIMRNGNKY